MSGGAFFLALVVRSTLWMVLVGLAAVAVRRAGGSAAMRHLVLLFGLGGLAMLPVLVWLMPPLALPILPEPVVPAATAPNALLVTSGPAAAVAATAPEAFGAVDLAAGLYLAVAAALLARLLMGRLLLARLWSRSRSAPDAGWNGLVLLLAGALGVRRRVGLRFAEGPAMPMTWGTLRPRILLPAAARGWSEEQRRMVLLHELAHVSRFDSFSRAATEIVCALYWFHPVAWYAARRMRIEQEHACDDLVLTQGAAASAYARGLLEAARAFAAPPILARMSVAMVATSELERRLIGIVRGRPRGRASARFTFGVGAAALIGTAVAATVTPVAADQAPMPPLPPAAAPSPPNLLSPPPRVAPRARASDFERVPTAPAPVPPPNAIAMTTALAAPAPPAAPTPPILPTAPTAPVAPAAGSAGFDYESALADYRRDLGAYDAAQRRYNRDLALYNRQLAALARDGNLANSGNSGNSGNTGNPGVPARPAHGSRRAIPAVPPTPPTLPTAPTPPTPLKPPQLGP